MYINYSQTIPEREMPLDSLPLVEKIHYIITQQLPLDQYGAKIPIYMLMEYGIECPDSNSYDYYKMILYHRIFDEMLNDITNMKYICCSDDIQEEQGDYDYLVSWLSSDIPFLFMRSSHPHGYPHELILYDPKWQIHIIDDYDTIEVVPVVDRIRDMFKLSDRFFMKEIKSHLKNTDHVWYCEWMQDEMK